MEEVSSFYGNKLPAYSFVLMIEHDKLVYDGNTAGCDDYVDR